MPQNPLVYRLEGQSPDWGDYGRILQHGMSAHLERDAFDRIQLERTGPYVPPITFPGSGDVIVTLALRAAVEASGLSGFAFREVILARIVRLDWHLWDLTADEPRELPEGGEPEGYVLDHPHDPHLAEQIGPLWEVDLGIGAEAVIETPDPRVSWKYNVHLVSGSITGLDIFRASQTGRSFVSERCREFLERNAAQCVKFERVEFRPPAR